jgi:hypothetical protein
VIRGLVTGLSAALFLAGCGGSDRLNADQLRTKAAVLCTSAGRQTNRIPTPSSPAAGVAFLRSGIAALEPELSGLKALKPPTDLAQVYSTSVGAFAQKLRALKAAVQEIDSGANPVTAMTALEQRLAPIESAEDGAWQALEVPACLNHSAAN